MKRRTKVVIGVFGLVVVLGGASALKAGNGNPENDTEDTVTAALGDIVDKALAVGTIEPEVEIEVKSQISGVVQRLFAEDGDFVQLGEPLIEVKPNPTPLELAQARRQVQLREVELANLRRDVERNDALLEQGLVSEQESQNTKQLFEQMEIQRQIAAERLSLMEEGRITSGYSAPADGRDGELGLPGHGR
jgi:HlyD family secretion protein